MSDCKRGSSLKRPFSPLEVVQLLTWCAISSFFTLPSGRVGPKGRRGGALPGRYASVSLGNRGLTPSG